MLFFHSLCNFFVHFFLFPCWWQFFLSCLLTATYVTAGKCILDEDICLSVCACVRSWVYVSFGISKCHVWFNSHQIFWGKDPHTHTHVHQYRDNFIWFRGITPKIKTPKQLHRIAKISPRINMKMFKCNQIQKENIKFCSNLVVHICMSKREN